MPSYTSLAMIFQSRGKQKDQSQITACDWHSLNHSEVFHQCSKVSVQNLRCSSMLSRTLMSITHWEPFILADCTFPTNHRFTFLSVVASCLGFCEYCCSHFLPGDWCCNVCVWSALSCVVCAPQYCRDARWQERSRCNLSGSAILEYLKLCSLILA